MRNQVAVSALRSALSAISNAEAVSAPPAVAAASSPYIAGATAGPGAGDAPRRHLSAADLEQIVRAEVSERLLAARDYERAGHADWARRLRSEASVLMLAAAGEPQH